MPKLNVDLATLLKPINNRAPSGESLRRSAVYDKIKEARRQDDANLSQGIWKTALKQADWREVEETCLDALQNKSKDLRIAAWLVEAWLARYGIEGCEQGFRLVESLVNRFWDTMYPEIEDGDLDARMAPIAWINEKLSMEVKNIALTKPETKEPQIFTWADWERASMAERAGQTQNPEEVTTAQFMTCVLLTPAAFYIKLEQDLGHLWEAAVDLEQVIDKRCGQPMAALYQFKEVLRAIREFTSRAVNQKAEEEPKETPEEDDAVAEDSTAVATSPEASGAPGLRWGPIRNRAEAYQRLAEAADYLLRTEPHSPTPHLVRRAVSWGNMNFTELIQELVRDQNDLGQIYGLLGIQSPND